LAGVPFTSANKSFSTLYGSVKQWLHVEIFTVARMHSKSAWSVNRSRASLMRASITALLHDPLSTNRFTASLACASV